MGRLGIGLISLLLLLITLSIPEAASGLPLLSAPIGTWSALDAAVKAAGQTVTLTLSPSFTMAGYVGTPSFVATEVSIEGHGATFDAADKGSFFFLVNSKTSLTVRNVTMKNVS
jgi:hypothetical protein